MKISNNALNFLLAQYRAIFKRAYVKGLASAVILTAGLAAGQAQAAATQITDANISGTLALDTEIKIDGTNYSGMAIVGSGMSSNEWNADVIITSGSLSNVSIKGTSGAVILSGDGTLNIALTSGTAASGGLTVEGGASGSVSLDLTNVAVSLGTLDIKDGNQSGGATVLANDITIGSADAEATETKSGVISLTAASGSTATLGNTDSAITINGDGQLTVTASSGTATVEGSLALQNGGLLVLSGSGGTVALNTDLNVDQDSTVVVSSNSGNFAGNTAQMNGNLLVVSGGVLNLNTDQPSEDEAAADPSLGVVTLGATSNTQIGGTLNVNSGTLVVEKGASLHASNSGSIAVASGDNTLQINSQTLKDYLKGGKSVTTIAADGATTSGTSTSGQIVFNSGSTLEFSDTETEQVDLAQFTYATSGSAGAIGASGTTTIKGKNFLISKQISSGSNISIKSTDLTLGSSTFTSGSLGFSGATAVNLHTTQGGFALGSGTVTLDVTLGDDIVVSDETGVIEGDYTLTASGGITVAHGTYTTDGDITISGGALRVENGELEDNGNIDSSLTLGQGTYLTLDQGSITVDGAGLDDVATRLDITKAELVMVSGSNSVAITAQSGGAIRATNDQFKNLLTPEVGGSGTSIYVNDGSFEVDGDISLTGAQLTSNTSGTAGSFVFNSTSGGLLTVEGELELTDVNTLDLGSNKSEVVAETLNLKAATAASGTVTLQQGTFTALEGLTSNTSSTKVNISGAAVALGAIDGDGTSENPYTALTTGGRIGTELTLSDGELDVVAGNWVGSKATVTSGTLTIGSVDRQGIGFTNAQGNAITAGLTLDSLDVTSEVDVTKVGTLTVDSLTTAEAGNLNVQGTVTINGDYTASGASTDEDFGIKLAAKSVDVGQGATVIIGDDATRAITVSDTKDTTNGYITIADSTFGGKVFSVEAAGVVQFAFGEDVTFNADSIAEFRDTLFNYNEAKGVIDGYINLGDATIDGLAVAEDGTLEWETLSGYTDIIADVTTQDLAQAKVINFENNAYVRGNLGSLTTVENYTSDKILVDGNLTLNNAAGNNGNFASTATGSLLGLEVTTPANIVLNNGGNIGDITFKEGDSSLTVNSANGTTNIAAIDGSEATAAFTTGTAVVAGTTEVAQLTTEAGTTTTFRGAVTVGEDATGNATSNIAGTTTFEADATFAQAANLAGTTNFKQNVSFDGVTAIKGETTVAETASFDAATTIANNGVLRAQDVVLTANSANPIVFSVGVDTTSTTTNEVGTGYLEVESFTLAGNDLVVDPAYSQATSVAAISGFADGAGSITDAGTVDGRIFVGRNAALDVGSSASIAHMQQFIQNYQRNGSLVEDEVGAVMYLSDKLTVENEGRIILDSQRSSSALLERAKLDATGYGDGTAAADLYLGQNTVLAIGDNILEDGAAIHFDKTGAGIMAEDASATIVLDGDKFLNSRNIVLFTDDDGGVKVLGDNNIRVETLNGVMYFEYEAGSETTSKTLQLDTYKIDTAFRGATDESRDLLLAYASRTANWEEYYADQANQGTSTKEDPKATNTPVERDPLVAGLASRGEATWDSNTNSIVVTSSAQQAGLTADDFIHQEIRDEDGNVIGHEIYRLAHNQFLESVARNTDGRALDSAALQSVFGGSAQAALLAARTSQDAVAGRVGVGASSSALTFADNGQGAGLWVAPVYVSQDSDGFAVENKDYGVDIDLYGVALGGDYTLANGLRLGAFFNVGTGDADGNGQASGVSNDFDYYSLGLYAGYSMGQFSVVGDVSYSVVDSDIDASTSVGTLKSSFDTDNISVGVTGQYELSFGATSITPHLGLRYSSIGIDDYRIETGYADGGNFDSDTLSVFSVPVGVTIAQDFTAGSWQVKPSFDLTLQGNFGDDEIDATTNWDGVANWASNYTAEFLDNFTYGATVGVAAKNGNFSAGIGLGYTGSENTDEFSATANARFVF